MPRLYTHMMDIEFLVKSILIPVTVSVITTVVALVIARYKDQRNYKAQAIAALLKYDDYDVYTNWRDDEQVLGKFCDQQRQVIVGLQPLLPNIDFREFLDASWGYGDPKRTPTIIRKLLKDLGYKGPIDNIGRVRL